MTDTSHPPPLNPTLWRTGKMLAGLALALLAWGASQIYADLKAARAPEASSVTAAP